MNNPTPTRPPKIGIDETMYASNQGTIQITGTTPTETVSDCDCGVDQTLHPNTHGKRCKSLEPTVEKWEEKVGETVEHLVTVIGIDWEEAHDETISQKKKERAYKSACKYAREYIDEAVAHSVQEAKAEREKIVIADDGDYVKVPMTVIKHIWDMRMPQTSHWRESGEIHYNKAIEDILRLIKPNILSTLNTNASLKQEEGK